MYLYLLAQPITVQFRTLCNVCNICYTFGTGVEGGLCPPSQVKLVVIGMACFLRSVSLLGPLLYTITHVICVPADGMSAANIQQLAMRHGGRTLERRRERGYECVTVLMSRGDWQLVRSLYDLTAELLRMCGTGTCEGLGAWKAAQFEPRFRAVVETARKHSEKSVDPDKVIKRLPVAAPAPAAPPVELDLGAGYLYLQVLALLATGVAGPDGVFTLEGARAHPRLGPMLRANHSHIRELSRKRLISREDRGMYRLTQAGRDAAGRFLARRAG